MKTLTCVALTLALFSVSSVQAAAGGSPGGAGAPTPTARQQLTPEQKAVVRYNAGIKHRDKAMKFEKQMLSQKNEKKLAKLQKKVAKEYNKAIDDYEAAIKHVADFYEVHSSLGYALRKIGRYEDSLAAYNESLRLNPSYGEAIEYRGEAYLGLNRLDDAKDAYMTLFQNEPALADQLLAAMISWVAERRDNANGLDSATLNDFATWVNQRTEFASYLQRTDSTSTNRWAE